MSKTLNDLIYEEIHKKVALPALVTEGMAKAALAKMMDALTAAGWTINPPGTPLGFGPPVEGISVRCPGCHALDPDLGFKSEIREIPQGEGSAPVHAGIAYIFCAKETCHTILSVAAAPMQAQSGVIQ